MSSMVTGRRRIYTACVKNKPAKNLPQKLDDGAEEDLSAVDAYEELAVFFDEEDPMALVSSGSAGPGARFRTRDE